MTGAAFTIEAPLPMAIAIEDSPVFAVYPNPAEKVLYINLPLPYMSAVELTLLDVKAINVLTTTYPPGYSSAITLDVANLQQGLYLVRLKSKTAVFNVKFYKQ